MNFHITAQEKATLIHALKSHEITTEGMEKMAKGLTNTPIRGEVLEAIQKEKRIIQGLYLQLGRLIFLNGRSVDPLSLTVEGINKEDYPDLVDSFFSFGTYLEGDQRNLNDKELEQLTSENPELVNKMATESFINCL